MRVRGEGGVTQACLPAACARPASSSSRGRAARHTGAPARARRCRPSWPRREAENERLNPERELP